MADLFWRRLIIIGIVGLPVSMQAQQRYLTVPGDMEYTHLDTSGVSVLPSGRYLTPAGQTIQIAHDPFGMAVSPDGSKTVTLHNGIFTVIDNTTLKSTMVGWIGDIPGQDRLDFAADSYRQSIPSPLPHGSFLGVAFGSDNHTVYLSGGDNGAVIVYDIATFKKLDSISLNGPVDGVNYEDSFTSDLIFNDSGMSCWCWTEETSEWCGSTWVRGKLPRPSLRKAALWTGPKSRPFPGVCGQCRHV